MVPGIDLAGTVEVSGHPDYKVGDQVVLNGWGVGEGHWGGLAQKARLNGDWLIPLPREFTAAQAMAIGTAGYTAMLSILALEHNGVTPEQGDVLVTRWPTPVISHEIGLSEAIAAAPRLLAGQLRGRVVVDVNR